MLRVEKRRTLSIGTSIAVGVVSVIAALVISTIVLKIMGYNPVEVFSSSFRKTFLRRNGILENFVMIVPLSLCALSVVFAAKAGLWNIGVEGQFYAGALAATGVGVFLPGLPGPILVPLMFLAGAAAAGVLCVISVIPRVYWGISEILTTILMNSVVLYFVKYLVYDAWHDKGTVAAQTAEIAPQAHLPILIRDSRIHLGLLITVAILIGVHFLIRKTVYGYEMRAVGNNPDGARYAGINVRRYFFTSMFISGCLAGVAGMLEVSGTVFRLQPTISADYGFSAFIIAWIGRLSVPAIAVISYFFGGLLVAGFKMQMMGFPSSVTFLIKGLVLILVLAGELLTFYRIYWVKKGSNLGVGAGGTRASPGRGEGEATTAGVAEAGKD